jgi:hypothetical protein
LEAHNSTRHTFLQTRKNRINTRKISPIISQCGLKAENTSRASGPSSKPAQPGKLGPQIVSFLVPLGPASSPKSSGCRAPASGSHGWHGHRLPLAHPRRLCLRSPCVGRLRPIGIWLVMGSRNKLPLFLLI